MPMAPPPPRPYPPRGDSPEPIGVRTWDLWLFVAIVVACFAAAIVIQLRDGARCSERGGVWVAGACLRKDVVLP